MEHILSTIIFLPFVSAIVLGLFRVSLKTLKAGAIISSALTLILVLIVVYNFNPDAKMQFIEYSSWIKNSGISYYIGVDYLSIVLLVLISMLIPLLYMYMHKEKRKGYWYNIMMLQTGVTGAVLSLDLILFYMFWETMLLPIFIMIGKYGHSINKRNSMKILLMTVFGSMSMLFSIFYIGYMHYDIYGVWSFSLDTLEVLKYDADTSIWLAGGFLLAFLIKIPILGFHTWMPSAYGSSPTPAVVILSSIMAKLGIYGIWRFGYSLFEQTLYLYTPSIIILALIGLIYFAIRAISEENLKIMFAYSSGSHLSLIAVGLLLSNVYSLSGSLYLIATHALASAGIFLMIGLIYKRFKTLQIGSLGAIASDAPKFAFFFVFFSLSIAGVPGTGGFVAELLIIIGAFKANFWIGVATSTTILLAMMYIFWMLQRTIFGTRRNTKKFKDLTTIEIYMLTPLLILLILTGIAPSIFAPIFESGITSSIISNSVFDINGILR